MLAGVADHHGDRFDMREVPVETPGPGQVLVKIVTSGVCHTDVHAVDGDWPAPTKLPLIPGHEGAGIIVAVGPDVSSTIAAVGDRVGIPWLHSSCGTCEHCLSGHENLCPKQDNTGYSVDGCFAQYTLAPAAHVAKIPDAVSFEQAAPILCAGVTTYSGIKATEARPGQFLTVIGAAGGLGHLAVQFGVAMGLRVLALDCGVDKLKFCTDTLGAEAAFEAMDPEVAAHVTKATNGGSHGVLCLAPSIGAFKSAVGLCRRGGTIVMVGLPKGDMPLNIFDIVIRGITVRGSIVGTRKDLAEALDFAAQGKVNCHVDVHPFEELNQMFDDLRSGKVLGRIVLNVSGD